ncbi:MAG: TetR/AcrR family transcriptional regulator, partial [Bacteroidales bacterium]|nr:TetR/AcrR family transcriptional regulator [Bacteroidales bacterium]
IMAKQSSLEEKIILAAEEIFMNKGFDATSTTDIAKKVGCNQALIHYYFRTKENLFQQIFMKKFQLVLSFIIQENQPTDIEKALLRFIDNYFVMLSQNRKLPFFLITELIMNEERRNMLRLHLLMQSEKLGYYANWDKLVKEEIKNGKIRPIETIDLTLDVISLVVFTFLSLPLYSDLFQSNEVQLENYLQHRKEEIVTLILKGIKNT